MNNDKQHREDTKYKQWADGMYVMLDDLEDNYELALIEDGLRDSVYFRGRSCFMAFSIDACYGVRAKFAGSWAGAKGKHLKVRITRAQALYISTGDANI